jgi:hypothetical protein
VHATRLDGVDLSEMAGALDQIFEEAVEKGKRLRVKPGRPKKGTENAGNARINYQTAEHIRARLERDGQTELLAKIERGASGV